MHISSPAIVLFEIFENVNLMWHTLKALRILPRRRVDLMDSLANAQIKTILTHPE